MMPPSDSILTGQTEMNAEAHLRAQGWQGPGTGLRAGSLQRAILTSKKTDLKGLGAKQDESDQWWDKVFSSQLSNITVKGTAIEQINGGVKAAHPIAARNAHRHQFGERSALEKVFQMGEVLKGSECFIPLAPILAVTTPASQAASPQKKQKRSESKRHKKGSKDETTLLPSPPLFPARGPLLKKSKKSTTTADALASLSDRAIRKEAKRIRREERARRRQAKQEKTARKEARRAARAARPKEKQTG